MSTSPNTPKITTSGILLFVKIALVLILWIPNLIGLYSFCGYLKSEESLRSGPMVKQTGIFIDIAKYYACTKIAQSNPAQIWDWTVQENWFKSYLNLPHSLDLYATEKLSAAQYTPQSVCMLMPFCALPLNAVIIITTILGLLAMIIPVTLLMKKNFKFSNWEIVYWWLLFLGAAPIAEHFSYGQLDIFLAGLAAVFLLTWQNNFLPAAVALALTIAIKPQHAFVLLIMSLATKKLRLLGSAAIISIILLALAAAILGVKPVIEYPMKLLAIETAIDNHQLPAPTTLVVSVLAPVSILFGRHVARLAALPAALLWRALQQVHPWIGSTHAREFN